MTKVSEISQESLDTVDVEKRLQNRCKHLLKNTLFIGSFREKRFVDSLNSYRDVIKINDSEDDLIENLLIVKKRCTDFYGNKLWIGITTPRTIGAPVGYNVWVNLDEEVFGTYWYKIRNIHFDGNEICLKLKTVRPYEKQRIETVGNSEESTTTTEEIVENSKKVLNESLQKFVEEMKQLLTFNNIKQSTVFLFCLFATILTFLIHSLQFLLEYMLKLLQELTKLIKAFTPIIETFMKCSTQFINGLLATIAFLLRGNAPTNPSRTTATVPYAYRYPDERYIQARGLPNPQMIYSGARRFPTYRPSSVKITPLD